jgi:ribosomal-protein-alanine N-acetyltransferase
MLRGKKITLKVFTTEDITEDYIAWLNDPIVMQYSNQRFLNHTPESCVKYLNSFENTANIFMVIRDCTTGCSIGTLTAYVNKIHRTADVGILIGNSKYWANGFGYDAWSTFHDWLFREVGLRKLTAGALSCNRAMIRLMEKSGMTLEGVRTNQECFGDDYADILLYGKFSDNFVVAKY